MTETTIESVAGRIRDAVGYRPLHVTIEGAGRYRAWFSLAPEADDDLRSSLRIEVRGAESLASALRQLAEASEELRQYADIVDTRGAAHALHSIAVWRQADDLRREGLER